MDVSVACPSCSADLHMGEAFCQGCGAEVTPELKSALRMRLEASDSSFRQKSEQVKSATRILLWLAFAFVIGGGVLYVQALSTAKDALKNLSSLPPAMELTVEGKVYTVARLREVIENEPLQLIYTNVGLAVILVGLYFWARRSPLPALVTAFAIYVTVIAVSAVLDPKTLAMGILLKVIAVIAFVRGIRSALEFHKLERGRG